MRKSPVPIMLRKIFRNGENIMSLFCALLTLPLFACGTACTGHAKSAASYENITGVCCREEHADRRFSFSFLMRRTGNRTVFDARFFDKEDKEVKISKAEIADSEFEKLRILLRSLNAIEHIQNKKTRKLKRLMPEASDAPIYGLELEFSDGTVLSSDTAAEFGGELKRALTDIAENAAAHLRNRGGVPELFRQTAAEK